MTEKIRMWAGDVEELNNQMEKVEFASEKREPFQLIWIGISEMTN